MPEEDYIPDDLQEEVPGGLDVPSGESSLQDRLEANRSRLDRFRDNRKDKLGKRKGEGGPKSRRQKKKELEQAKKSGKKPRELGQEGIGKTGGVAGKGIGKTGNITGAVGKKATEKAGEKAADKAFGATIGSVLPGGPITGKALGKAVELLGGWKKTGLKIAMATGGVIIGGLIILLSFSGLSGGGGSDAAYGSTIPGVLNVPYMNQFRDDPNNCSGGTQWNGAKSPPSGGFNGCGGTSQAMVENYINKDGTTLETIYERRCARGSCSNRFDLYEMNQRISASGIQYSRKVFSGGENPGEAETEEAMKKIEKSIDKGYPAVIHVLPPFAASQHIMLITGFNANGDVYINDPNCGRDAPPFLELGTPQGKNNLASRQALKEAMRAWYEYVE